MAIKGKQGEQGYQGSKARKAIRAAGLVREEQKQYGHKKMVVWNMADELDVMVQSILNKIPKTEFKLREQLDAAADSVVSNFVEGYYSGSLAEYIKFCKYSKRSLGEVQQRIRRVLRKGYITEDEYLETDKKAGKTMYLFNRLLDSLEKKRACQKK